MKELKNKVEVVYALPMKQFIVHIDVDNETTVQQAIELSGVLELYSEIDLSKNKVGIFSKIVDLNRVCEDADRIEIYRELAADPREIRERRMNPKANK